MARTKSQFAMLSDIQDQFQTTFEEADALLRAIIAEGRDRATVAELDHFQKLVSWDEKEVKVQLSRMQTVVYFEAIAGSKADREATQAEAEAATDVLKSETARVAELQAKLPGYDRAARLAQQRVEQQSHALEQLKKHCPQHIRERADRMQSDAHKGPYARMNELQSRKDELLNLQQPVGVLNRDYQMRRIQDFCPEAVTDVIGWDGSVSHREFTPEWEVIKQRWNQAIELEINPAIEAARAEYEAAELAADAARNYYALG